MPRLYSPLERQLALQQLWHWLESSGHDEDRNRAIQVFLNVLDDVVPEEAIDDVLDQPTIRDLMFGRLCADALIGVGRRAHLEPRISRALRQSHLDRWPDSSHPTLDGATARRAASDPARRGAVARRLRGFEDPDAAVARRDGAVPLDPARVWEGLGLG